MCHNTALFFGDISWISLFRTHTRKARNKATATSFIIMMVLMFAAFYFLLIRPQQKKQKQHQSLVAGLQVGDEVLTAGGILGKITGVSEHYAVVSDQRQHRDQDSEGQRLDGCSERHVRRSMNKFPAWLNALVLAILLAGCLFALPNIYGSVEAVQIADNDGVAYDDPGSKSSCAPSRTRA